MFRSLLDAKAGPAAVTEAVSEASLRCVERYGAYVSCRGGEDQTDADGGSDSDGDGDGSGVGALAGIGIGMGVGAGQGRGRGRGRGVGVGADSSTLDLTGGDWLN